MKRHDWKVKWDDAGAGIGEYDSYECSGCGGWGGVPSEVFDRRTSPFFTLGSEQIQLDLDCDIAKAQIEALKQKEAAPRKPAIKLLPDALVEEARKAGAYSLKLAFGTKEAVIGAGVPATVANLLDIVSMEVWMRLGDETRQVQVFSPDDFSTNGFARGEETDAKAIADALGCNLRWTLSRTHEGQWTAEDLKEAIRLLGETP